MSAERWMFLDTGDSCTAGLVLEGSGLPWDTCPTERMLTEGAGPASEAAPATVIHTSSSFPSLAASQEMAGKRLKAR